jgi:hypothetical protein
MRRARCLAAALRGWGRHRGIRLGLEIRLVLGLLRADSGIRRQGSEIHHRVLETRRELRGLERLLPQLRRLRRRKIEFDRGLARIRTDLFLGNGTQLADASVRAYDVGE